MVSLVNCHAISLLSAFFYIFYKCGRGSMTCPEHAALSDGELVGSTPIIFH